MLSLCCESNNHIMPWGRCPRRQIVHSSYPMRHGVCFVPFLCKVYAFLFQVARAQNIWLNIVIWTSQLMWAYSVKVDGMCYCTVICRVTWQLSFAMTQGSFFTCFQQDLFCGLIIYNIPMLSKYNKSDQLVCGRSLKLTEIEVFGVLNGSLKHVVSMRLPEI